MCFWCGLGVVLSQVRGNGELASVCRRLGDGLSQVRWNGELASVCRRLGDGLSQVRIGSVGGRWSNGELASFCRRLDDGLSQVRRGSVGGRWSADDRRSEEHTSELQSLMRISYAVFCLKKKMK